MNQQERYELLTKLSEFYVKEVKYNLECFNKAKFISYTSNTLFWILSSSILAIFTYMFVESNYGKIIKIKGFEVVLIFLLFLLFFVAFVSIEILKKMDQKNQIHVLGDHGNSATLPMSADNEIKKRIMSKFVALFGDFTWDYYSNPSRFKQSKMTLTGLNILKNPLKIFDDYISGTYKGINLKMVDADTSILKIQLVVLISFGVFICAFTGIFGFVLYGAFAIVFLVVYITSKQFKGLVVEIDMNKDFEGHTFILEKNNVKDNLTVDKGKYQEVNLEDVEFSNEYNVYSQNQIEARYILTTAFMERIKNIKETFKAKYVRVSFKDKKIVILIHTGRDMFNLGNFLSDIGEKTFVQCFEEICSVLDLVEELKLNEKLGL